MSRIGIRPVVISENIQIEIKPNEFIAKGPNGELLVSIPHGIKVKHSKNTVVIERVGDSKHYRALHGTVRALIQNAVIGVANKFEKKLELVGIGYRAAIDGSSLILQVGFTHSVKMDIPENLEVAVQKNIISVAGANKQVLGQFCANVRAVRKPEPYKGKGIRYVGEKIRMKQGKAIKTGE